MPVTINGSGLASGVTSVPNLATFPAGPRLANVNMPVGSVLQVVNVANTTSTSTTSQTYADTGLSATITPSSTSSKILVITSIPYELGTSTNNGGFFKLLRGATNICEYSYNPYQYGTGLSGSNYIDGVSVMNVLDSPAATTATTYKMQFRIYTSSNSLTISNYNAPASITLMEIAG